MSSEQAGQATVEEVMANVAGSISRSVALKAVETLNESFKADPETIAALVENRIRSNIPPDRDSPAVYTTDENGYLLGLLGVINAIVERQSGERICAIYEDSEGKKLEGFALLSDVKKSGKEIARIRNTKAR